MVVSFRVYKKTSPNGKVTLYLPKRDIVDHFSHVDPIDGIIILDSSYLADRIIYGQVLVNLRYGREEDEVMGLQFSKDLYLISEEVYPKAAKQHQPTVIQQRLLRKLGNNAFAFHFELPLHSPASVTLQQGLEDQGKPCGVQYLVKFYVAQSPDDRGHKRSTVSLGIRKIQFAPSKGGKQPCAIIRKDFLLSPGQLELEVTLDKQLYYHGDKIGINVSIRNYSNKVVKKIRTSIVQVIDICLFSNGQYKIVVANMETQDGCPLQPGSNLQKSVYLLPILDNNLNRRGIALDGQLKHENTNLASSTLMTDPDWKDAFGIIITYMAKVKLYLGALGGEVTAELPFMLMHPKPNPKQLIKADSQAEVEQIISSRQNTIDSIGEDDGYPIEAFNNEKNSVTEKKNL